MEFPYFPTLQLDKSPTTVDVRSLKLDCGSSALPVDILAPDTMRDNLTESPSASSELHLA